ncbi:MAG: type II toxin-antitoxin system mRNA interferase toxin, RelE/StbE family [Cyanobacteria bacterium]|uniref:type II toxin-antitoxin system RelE/ParE family toxin n=1 Tax=Geminocystis sp. TaxID=2664100 RepID=UPI001D38A4A7|nr:type II toxin-antitoxin system mRNA interferase toxin, RelE/StbE family [Cyanobacteria bacterium CG_2015-16_32_12]NCO79480.1 type II toxin-antitoxin system mRNA interferase toxin, RelE/StbE family [Cyanobacteria bacterium CG_2015-22_32_23]NCQ05575.1 type II toxin-antitoxin system mRNA interferase toxin, RelE/StbE family [Cyanobacteria bacterium CG_2015-09_32_10]NCQ42936.1 type II toxin-antitoxin system mRNA interferase toxin, RelE/StbE family [Cyanobacteria bacterium CG_2015-04_32_10]NCS8399
MNLVAQKSFKKAFKRLTKKSPQLQDKILEVLDLLENDPFTPSLKSHKLTGNLAKCWSCSVSYDYRIIFTLSKDTESNDMVIILVDIGNHDEVY